MYYILVLRYCYMAYWSMAHVYSYGISLSYVRRIKVYVLRSRIYVWRMKRTRDVSTAYPLRSILICGVSVVYQLRFKTYMNKRLCSLCWCNSRIAVIYNQRSEMPKKDNLDEH